MLGPNGKEFTDLDGVGGSPVADTGAANAGPTTQNIDLSNLNLDTGAVGADGSPTADNNNVSGSSNTDGATAAYNRYEFDYTPTPFNPAKTDRCLVENIAIMVGLAVNMILGIASAATVQLEYREPALTIQITAGIVRGCLGSECGHYILPQVFCDRYLDNSAGYLACLIIAVLISLVAFIFSICSACGRMFISKYLVIALTIVSWLFFLVSVICLSTLRTSKLCNGVSLASLGFKYGPSFPLVLTLFLLLSLNIFFYFFMRCKRPVRYRYN